MTLEWSSPTTIMSNKKKRKRTKAEAIHGEKNADKKNKIKQCTLPFCHWVVGDKLNDSGDGEHNRVTRSGRHIYFRAYVNKESVNALNEHLMTIREEWTAVQSNSPEFTVTPRPIFLHINSYGGSVFAGFWAVDIIRQSSIPIYTIVEGAVASCGTMMSVVGQKRFIRPTASMLIHQLSSEHGGKMEEIKDDFKNLEQMTDAIHAIYLKHTKIGKKKLAKLLKHDLWWMKDKCIQLGLVDAVWNERLETQL